MARIDHAFVGWKREKVYYGDVRQSSRQHGHT